MHPDIPGDELDLLKRSNMLRTLRRVDSEQSARLIIDGREYISLCSNNYLGLANHPALKDASIEAIKKYGNSAGASRLISGNMGLHEALERATALFKHTEDALLFNTGYMANVGTIQALANDRDAIFSDELNHASLIDGCRLSRAKVFIYKHRDVEHLRSLLAQSLLSTTGGVPRYRRRLVVTDSVFSMDGDIAPIPEIAEVVAEHDAILMVDDAHATGVLGKNGRGSSEHFGVRNGIHIQMGTYGKALGSFGAYIACTKTVRDYLINKARAFIYTTALPPSVTAASLSAIKVLREDCEMLDRLRKNTKFFREGLKGLGFNTLNSETPIIPVFIGNVDKTLLFSNRLFDEGIFAAPIRPPTVPEGGCRIRTTVTALHTISDMEFCLDEFGKAGKELGII